MHIIAYYYYKHCQQFVLVSKELTKCFLDILYSKSKCSNRNTVYVWAA